MRDNGGADSRCIRDSEVADHLAHGDYSPVEYFPDGDGDGHGDPDGGSVLTCDHPAGCVPNSTDCDDTDPDRNPDAIEICDGIDNNCNLQIDEGLGTTTCGLGVCQHTIDNCVNGQSQQCNPLDGQSVETCDGLDNDCDGDVDEDNVCGSPDPGCAGQTCGTFTPCNLGGPCGAAGVCGSVAEGGGLCVNGSLACSGLLGCPNGSSDCPGGGLCLVNSCCGAPVCVPPSAFCPGAPPVTEPAAHREDGRNHPGPTLARP